jgi:hypothetical protein
MSKITELEPITGVNTRPEDLLVIVNLVQGDDGTKSITRKELVEAIQFEVFSRIEITGGTIENVLISNTDILDSRISTTSFTEGEITLSTFSDGEIFNTIANNMTISDSVFQTGDIDQSTFNDGEITNSTANNVEMTSSTFNDGEGNNNIFSSTTIQDGKVLRSDLVDFDMDLNNPYEDLRIDENSYFALKNQRTGETEQFTYKQFFSEISKSTAKALKVYVDVDGDDRNSGSILEPVRTLQRAAEIALEKAGGEYSRNDINNAIHISVGPGTYYIKESVWLPDDCALTSSAGQYATVIEAEKGFERINAILVGSGCYVQGFSFLNFEIDNFDFPTVGFGVAYRPGALLRRSPYIRDSSQLSNFKRLDVEPPLQPFNSKGTIADLGTQLILENDKTGIIAFEDEVTFSSGATAIITYINDLNNNELYVRNIKGNISPGDIIYAESGGLVTIAEIGPEDFPNPLVGRGGGCVLADRRVLDTDSLYTYVLCFGFTPRSQNGMGYVARNGAGINGIGSLSIFVRCAFYALEGGQMTLNNSGTQFGDISMRAKGTTEIFQPRSTEVDLTQDVNFADTLLQNSEIIIDDLVEYLTANTVNGGLDYQTYDAEKCKRDSEIIVDSVGYDIALNSNYWGRLCGITYRSPISYVVVNEQLTETTGAINHLREVVSDVFQNANNAIIERANTSFTEILNVLENGENYASPILFEDTGVVARTASRQLLQENKDFITDELIDWIEDNDEFFAYDSTKCRRDTTDYILPAVKYDMMLGTNYNTVTAGDAYYMATASKVLNNQKDETISAYKKLRDKTSELILNQANSELSAIASDESFDQIINIIKNGQSNNILIFSDDDGIDANKKDARVQLQNNRFYIQEHIMGYIANTYFVYDGDKCQRDISEYILPAVQRDLLLGTNFNSIQTGIGYYSATASEVVDSQLIETSGSVTHLKELVANNVIDDASSIVRTNQAFGEIIDIMLNGLNAANTIIWTDPGESDKLQARTNAKDQLQINREFLQEEVIAWIENNYFAYDGEKCRRDVGLILDAVKRDIATGSNFNSIFAGLSYRSGNESTEIVVNDQLTETVGAINWVKDRILLDLNNDSAIRATSAFNEIIDIMTNGIVSADTINFGSLTINANTEIGASLLQSNKNFFTAEITAWIANKYPTLTYDVAKCERDVGYLIDSVTWDIKNSSNAGSVNNARMYFDNAVSVLPENQKVITAKAFEHLAEVAYLVLQNITVVNTIGNGLSQNNATGSAGIAIANDVRDLLSIVPFVIKNDDFEIIPTYIEPSIESEMYLDGIITIDGLKPLVQFGVIDYIAETFNGLSYNKNLCRRDVGLIIDAVSKDIEYGYNNSIIDAGRYYFENAINILPDEQREPTRLAFEHLAAVAGNVVQNFNVAPTTGNITTQNIAGSASNADIATELVSLIQTLANLVDNSSIEEIQVPAAFIKDPNRKVARQQLQANKLFIQNEIIAYINDRYQKDRYFTYDSEKCFRDVGYIVDAISHDIQYRGNAAVLNVAGIYFLNAINVLPENQREPTKFAFQHLANIIETIVQRRSITPTEGNTISQDLSIIGANPLIGEEVKDLALIVANIADDTINADLPARIDPDISWVNDNYIVSKEFIEDEVSNLTTQVINFISNNYNGLSFPTEKCKRDIGFLVDAISHDVQYSTNHATRIVAQIYFENGISVLPFDTRKQTADVYAYLATIISDIVQRISTDNPAYTDVLQDLGGFVSAATPTEGIEVAALVAIVEDVIRNDSLDSIPALKEPNISWVSQELKESSELIDINCDDLADAMIEWLNQEFSVLDYNKAKCKRDIGYLLDAFSFDLNYDGNVASRWNADFYFWNNIYRIPEDQREGTAKSYKRLGEICHDVVIGKYNGQNKNNELGTLVEAQKVQDLANIFYQTQINNDIEKLPLLKQPDMSWQENFFVFSKDILSKRKESISREVVRFVNAEYGFVDLNLTRRDAGNLIKFLADDFRVSSPVFGTEGSQTSIQTFVASLFDDNGRHVFPVFNPRITGLKYRGSLEDVTKLPDTNNKPNYAYIIPTIFNENYFEGDVWYWDGSIWINSGPNNTQLLQAFYKSWERMRDFIREQYSPTASTSNMLNALFNDILIASVLRPTVLTFGSLVESIAHQFNGASAGVNRRALPLNFRNVGAAISASASVLSEDGGRVRWSGADELNNQYFARGLKINGRTGRIEGRPFTSSVRKLARRASNSRASI